MRLTSAKKIEFIPITTMAQEIFDFPQPASNFIPDWYKKIKPYVSDDIQKPYKINKITKDIVPNKTVKKCMPFFDTITSGYVATLPFDLFFVNPEEYNGYEIIWNNISFNPVGEHSIEQIKGMDFPNNFDRIKKWEFPFIIKTPPGYSCYFSHPKYRFDLPFITLDGIVDTDSHPIPTNFPFFLKKDFRGKLKKGTPICQIIPFKREKWKMYEKKYQEKNNFLISKFNLIMDNSYKNNFWHKKEYK